MNLANQLYNTTIRSQLPRKIGVFNSVAIREPRLFDSRDHLPEYKTDLIQAVRSRVGPGDSVTIIGAGPGVSSVVAARQTGDRGRVTVYEAASQWVAKLPQTMALNGIPETRYRVHHALVGDAIDVDGDASGATTLTASELPAADVLELDCEGAELGILRSLSPEQTPPTVIVETHPSLGAATADVREALADLALTAVKVGEDPVDGDILVGHSDE